MSQSAPAGTVGPTAAADSRDAATTPDRYDLHGKRVSINYVPDLVVGPLTTGDPIRLTYQDDLQTLKFTAEEIRRVDVPDLGTIVSVTIGKTVDTGYISFSVLIPDITLTQGSGLSAAVSTVGVTTVHRTLLAFGYPQTQTYGTTRLRGTATKPTIIPLVTED